MGDILDKCKDSINAVVQTVSENIPTLQSIYIQSIELMNKGADIQMIVGAEAIPAFSLISGYVYNYKANRTERNINELIKQFSYIKNKQIDNEDTISYIRDTLIPITLESVVNEPQCEKIKYIVTGIESTINNKSLQFEDITFIYYDILNNLRLREIQILVEVYKMRMEEKTKEECGKFVKTEEEGFARYVVNKLKNKALITCPISWGELDGENLTSINITEIYITKLGIDFIEFITTKN